jgi:hypothetical protein
VKSLLDNPLVHDILFPIHRNAVLASSILNFWTSYAILGWIADFNVKKHDPGNIYALSSLDDNETTR